MWKYSISIMLLMCLFIGCATIPEKKIPKKQADELLKESEPERDKVGQGTYCYDATGTVVKAFKEVEGVGRASKHERQIDAENRAEEDALNKVMKKAGVDVYYGFSDTLTQYGTSSYQFVARYLMSWSRSMVSYEVENKKSTITQTDEIECTLKIKGKILYRGMPDAGYEIRTDMPDRKLGLDKISYRPGENVQISFRVTKDSYINILDIDEDGKVNLLYPNKFVTSNFIKTGEVFEFPGNAGIKLKAVLPEGRKETRELIHIIATKNASLFTAEETITTGVNEYFFEVGKSKDIINSRLAKLKREEWTMLLIPYDIRSQE